MSDLSKSTGCCSGSYLSKSDPEVYSQICEEVTRQHDYLEMIASENYVSPAVLEATGSVLTNKYAEGYPSARYYGGCEFVDKVENTAIERAKKIFGCNNANVQPHSGSQANMAAYFALVEPGAKVMAMDLKHGGHLTHGSHVNFSGRLFDIIPYGVKESDCTIDYDALYKTAVETKPALIIGGATAYPRIIDFPKLREIADKVGAKLMVDAAHIAGLIAGGAHPSPVPYSDVVTLTTHKTFRGPRGGMILSSTEEMGEAVNKSIFPGSQGGPLMHVIAAKAVAFGEVLEPEFKQYAEKIVSNCKILAEELMSNGFDLVSGGTDNHLILIDLSSRKVTGMDAEEAFGYAGVTVNKNSIPFDPERPSITSGIRIGSAALTTRGMGEPEMRKIVSIMKRAIDNLKDKETLIKLSDESHELACSFPIFAW
ncbi:serine hydroxymethyltransferase [Candidatus Latescibacterota bacterium]